MTGIQILDATIQDKEQIFLFFTDVLNHTFQENGIWDMQDDLMDEIAEKKNFFLESTVKSKKWRQFLLAKEKDRIIGCVAIGPANDSIVKGSQGQCTDWVEIGTVFVHSDFQKKGLGTRLIREMENWLKAHGIHHYVLDSGYPISKQIWTRKYGPPTYVMKDHWGEGLDHLIWCVELKCRG
jgi:GNAT superfamily N-acetyltransferase